MNLGLSDAFVVSGGGRKPVLNYVSGIAVDGEKVVLTDMLGAKKIVTGTLKSVDLTKNVILIETA